MYLSSSLPLPFPKIAAIAWCLLSLLFLSLQAKANEEIIHIYTHGESSVAFKNADGSITGPGIDRLTCVMQKLGKKFDLSIAPLSRAQNIVNGSKLAIWLPSNYEGDPERLSRLAGPAGAIEFSWHMLKDNNLDPKSDKFRETATVTTFSGSKMVEWLKNNNYNYVAGSADPNRLVYMLMSKEVDAVLSVKLGESTSQSVKMLIKENIKHIQHDIFESAFYFSKGLNATHPDFIHKFRSTLQSCL
jgi:hypothetical protein